MAVRTKAVKLGMKLIVVTPKYLPQSLRAEKGHILQVHFISDAFGLDAKYNNFNQGIIIKVDNLNTHEFESVVIDCKNKWLKGVNIYKEKTTPKK